MNGGNYEMWAMQVKRTLIAHDKEHLILEPEPVQKVGKYTTWFKDNSLIMVWIVGTLSQEIANEVLHKESAKDMWDSLAATYSQARNETRIMQLHHDIHQMRQDGRPLHTYYSSLKLYSVYESAKNQMLTSPSIPPIDEAYSRLSRIPISAVIVPDTTSAMLATRGRAIWMPAMHPQYCALCASATSLEEGAFPRLAVKLETAVHVLLTLRSLWTRFIGNGEVLLLTTQERGYMEKKHDTARQENMSKIEANGEADTDMKQPGFFLVLVAIMVHT
ncbi:hypothetical protein EJ110_NYTH58530 [Nymphaea thermarum]|nr:hypothetical protein EJ110_NYTH58530 [Nymphaea thermarum]